MRCLAGSAVARLSLVLLAAGLGGCAAPPPATPEQTRAGLVMLIPGMRGDASLLYGAANGLLEAGVEREVQIYDWYRFPSLANLVDYKRNCAHAEEIARRLAAYHDENPASPIDVIGYSAGGGLAIMALERLPEDVPVRRLVLVQAAVSPDYDLTRAARRVRDKVVNVYCPGDWLVLGLGTQVFGTVDRRCVESAGKRGFDAPRALSDAAARQKLVEVAWRPEMMGTLHFGGHVGILLRAWNRRFVAPLILTDDVTALMRESTQPSAP
ncbi:MAG: alpha/beta hydrolase [Phycisphaerae bacterium]|jgi:pimeloyl-ACP methyl ester carboxylesterase|nr:hypothetical protein [Phycisphaerae bacterium]MCZ2401573.1 alpha/beta hydrolase [Phycisphaerae bacterium]